MPLPLQQQERVGQADQGDVVMPALPAAPFVMVQSQFLFQLLIVLFHAPAEFGQLHQAWERDPLGQVREPVLAGSFRLGGPLAQQPDGFQLGPPLNMAMGRLHPASREAAALRASAALSPGYRPPLGGGQRGGQRTHRLRLPSIVRSTGTTQAPSPTGLDSPGGAVPNRRARLHPPPHRAGGGPPIPGGTRCCFRTPRRPARAAAASPTPADDRSTPKPALLCSERGCSREFPLCGNPPHPRSRLAEGTEPSPTAYFLLPWPNAPPPPLGNCPLCPRSPSIAALHPPTRDPAWEIPCHPQSRRPPAAVLLPYAAPTSGVPVPTPKGSVPRIAARPGRCLPAPVAPEALSTCVRRPATTLARTARRGVGAPSGLPAAEVSTKTLPADPRKLPLLGSS